MHIHDLKLTLEIFIAIAVFLNIFLAARNSIWNWLFGLVAVTLHGFISHQAKLYGNMSLQGVYFAFQIYGWYEWRYGSEKHSELSVTRIPKSQHAIIGIAFVILFFAYFFILSDYTNSTTPLIDALTTAMGLVAQWMMCKRWIENWFLWMIMDLIAIEMYWNKHLHLISALYASLFILCCYGYHIWKKAIKNN
jgi:nicotinamide mononucleotide transporter